MEHLAAPLLFAILFWWLSTGLILWLVGRPPETYKWTALGATAALAAASVAMLMLRDETGVAAAYAGFAIGILLWAWHETMFLLGFISGPRKSPCPPNLPFWSRFRASAETVIHHELAIAFHAAIILILTAGAANRIAAWTFLLLWGMRISSKLIIFSGAPNVADAFLPRHLDYLKSYFKKRAATPVFSVAMTLVASATAALIYHASLAPLGSFQSAGLILVSALAALAVLEHLALVAPLPDQALWAWARPRGERPDPFETPECDRNDSRWRR